ncbi:hypothetical protein TWF506_002058 [Arthrobotrys conoides]|uniref:Peptidase S1 domain-containing protein n=1 Tax=Arthrobotrys conoides TaxID=74498 RepID=A0AAN8NYH5_9PEZI
MTNITHSPNPSQCDTHGTKSLLPAESDTNCMVPAKEPMLLMHRDWSHIKWNPDPRTLNWSAFDKPSPGSSRCATQDTENPSCALGTRPSCAIEEYKPPLQPRNPGTPENKNTQRLMGMKWPTRGYEPGFISDSPEDIIKKSSTFPLRMRRKIPSYGATAFGGLCLNKNGGWSECHVVSSHGDTAIPSDNPAAELMQGESVVSSLCAVGRIFDPATGCSESGYWVQPGFFVTAFHFAKWNTNNRPTIEELYSLRNEGREFLVSCETITGIARDPSNVSVRFEDGIIESDCALFRPSDPTYQPRSWITMNQLLDPEMVEGLSLDLSKYCVFAVGYNGADYEGLDGYMEAYRKRFPNRFEGAGGTLTVEPDYAELFHPNRKTISYGSIKKYDASPQILVDCTCWKGYSGGPIFCILNEEKALPFVIGTIIGGLYDGFCNEGIQLPRRFADYLREIEKLPRQY